MELRNTTKLHFKVDIAMTVLSFAKSNLVVVVSSEQPLLMGFNNFAHKLIGRLLNQLFLFFLKQGLLLEFFLVNLLYVFFVSSHRTLHYLLSFW